MPSADPVRIPSCQIETMATVVATWVADGNRFFVFKQSVQHDNDDDSQEAEDEPEGTPEKSCKSSPGASNGDRRAKRQAAKGSDQKRRKKST